MDNLKMKLVNLKILIIASTAAVNDLVVRRLKFNLKIYFTRRRMQYYYRNHIILAEREINGSNSYTDKNYY